MSADNLLDPWCKATRLFQEFVVEVIRAPSRDLPRLDRLSKLRERRLGGGGGGEDRFNQISRLTLGDNMTISPAIPTFILILLL